MTLSEGLEAVGRMLNAMPNGRAGVADSYIGNMAALLCTFPRVVAQRCADPVHGVVTKTSFTPTVAEVVKFCEPLTGDMHRVVAREAAIAKQLEERAELENGPPSGRPKQTLEELRTEMRARGFPMGGPVPHKETPETVREKLNLTQAQWDAIPDADPGHWDQLMAKHRAAPTQGGA